MGRWFKHVHDYGGGEMNAYGFWIPRFNAGMFVWIPACAVAIIMIEELRKARQNSTQLGHVLGVPRLL